ncbi:methylated-DNA--[protein]-cysteine S-methyltransferase [Candidatus Methanodesulfokora washburnensis]|nr:MGMT family protein [Candidatus Methanodesulfokores washburnensis]
MRSQEYIVIEEVNKFFVGMVFREGKLFCNTLPLDSWDKAIFYLKRNYDIKKFHGEVDPRIQERARRVAESIFDLFMGKPVSVDLNILIETPNWSVLTSLLRIPRGKVCTYGELGKFFKMNPRAMGRIMGMNPFPLIIPCHRVIRSDMSLGGYSYGVDLKRKILEREGVKINRTNKVDISSLYRFTEAEV